MKTIISKFICISIFCLCGLINSNAQIEPKPAPLQQAYFKNFIADFDGDKINDTLKFITNIWRGNLDKGWKTDNPFGTDTLASVEPLGILVLLSKEKSVWFLHDSAYFSTPGWASGQMPVSIVKRGTKLFKAWKKGIYRLNFEAVMLGTEAGIDILLYWDKSRFKVFWPDEEP